MTNRRRVLHCAAVTIGAITLLTGCNRDDLGSNTPHASATTTTTPSTPTSFNGCQLPQSVVDAEQIDSNPMNADADADGGIKFRGCVWSTHNGDGFNINTWTTNLTVQMIETMSDYKVAERLTVDGRRAVTYHTSDDVDLREDCMIDVEMKGGGLDLLVDNPPSHKATGIQDSCEIIKRVAGEIVSTFPASA
ncbi:DUF3558 domain-containing protein [Nocardia sp. CA2R105]|uniref:DUF3558 domain-containing protein n=1 Tax=Nocardia coffeae TaxID=2873381 RepID=UPI001CA63DDB|nr:DUF3558 domain-containing protein [Nocardia coffeae]MBY8857519.1 DUF3558 domain-containing protein [Nocardia coffeae]